MIFLFVVSLLLPAVALAQATGSAGQTGGSGGSQAGSSNDYQEKKKLHESCRGPDNRMTVLIQGIDANQKKIAVIGSEQKKIDMTVASNAQITAKSGEQMQLAQLKSGMRVRVTYNGSKNSPEVTKMEIETG